MLMLMLMLKQLMLMLMPLLDLSALGLAMQQSQCLFAYVHWLLLHVQLLSLQLHASDSESYMDHASHRIEGLFDLSPPVDNKSFNLKLCWHSVIVIVIAIVSVCGLAMTCFLV